jgi:UDP-N-acetylmuramate dehydrogenase
MSVERVKELALQRDATFRAPEPLSAHFKLGIGGEAAFYVKPNSWKDAEKILLDLWSMNEPFKILGGGSNLMAKDGPLPFGVVHLTRLGGSARWQNQWVEADADVPMPLLSSDSVRRGLQGLEGMGGIPGTVGGAVIMNAGSFGNDMSKVIREVAIVEKGRGLIWRPASDFNFGYRFSDVTARGVVAGCRLELAAGDTAVLKARFQEVKARRESTQPWRAATAGSVFKNPEGDFAGRILENLGFKGRRRGAAGFSEHHANFLVNHGGATFEDAFALCEEARAEAKKIGKTLEYEMEIWT